MNDKKTAGLCIMMIILIGAVAPTTFEIGKLAITGRMESIISDTSDEKPVNTKSTGMTSTIAVDLISPVVGSRIRNNAKINISLDPVNEVSLVRYLWFGTSNHDDNVSSSEYASGYLSIPVPLEDGNYRLQFWAHDKPYDSSSYTYEFWDFIVDNSTVFITLISPVEGGHYQSGTPVKITFEPLPAGILYEWDGGTPTALQPSISEVTFPLPIGDGYHELTVQAEHAVTGSWSQASHGFYTDDTPATVTLLSPMNNTKVQSRTPINWLAENDVNETFFSWDGATNQSEPGVIPDVVGQHVLEVVTTDLVGNAGRFKFVFQATIKILFDYPVLLVGNNDTANVTVEARGYIKSSSSPVINFTDTPTEEYYNWWLNSTDAGTNETTVQPAPATEGTSKLLEVFARGSDGTWDHLLVNLTTDDTIPVLEKVSRVNESQLLAGTSITINASESLLHVHYSWDGATNGTDNSLPTVIGEHVLDLWLADHAENWLHVTFVYFTRYNVYLTELTNATTLLGGTLVNITIDPLPVAVHYSWDGGTTDSSPTPLPATSAWHVLNVTCEDATGNSYELFFAFLTELNISLVSPANYARLKSGASISLAYSDAPNAVLYSWDGGTQSFILKPLPAGDSQHELLVRAQNNDILHGMNWFEARFYFTVDDTAPVITSTSHDNNSRLNSGTELTFFIAENCSSADYSWDGGTIQGAVLGNLNVSLPLTPTVDGWHDLTVNVTDDLGNVKSYQFRYEVDDTPVSTFLHLPVNGSSTEAGGPVNISFSEPPVEAIFNWDNTTNQSSIGQLPWGNGSHVLEVFVFDGLNWNRTMYSWTTVDPLIEISLVSPANKSRIKRETFIEQFNVSFSETPVASWYSWNGSELTTELVAPADDGLFLLTIVASETSGSNNTLTMQYTFDDTAPRLIETEPDIQKVNATVTWTMHSTIVFTFDELVVDAYFRWNTTDSTGSHPDFVNLTNIIDRDVDDPSLSFNVILPKVEGYYNISVKVFDDLGNIGYYFIDFTITYEQPTFALPDWLVPLGFSAVMLIVAGLAAHTYREELGKGLSRIKNGFFEFLGRMRKSGNDA
jgi:hypothetical protein